MSGNFYRKLVTDVNKLTGKMESIFHEKQEGSLCAQHCLNALLQGSYFTAVDLAELARELDESERAHMAEAGMQSDAYRNFLEQPSGNFDDSGFFSIQVIQNALGVWNLELLPYTSSAEAARMAREDPRSKKAYICNFKEHWFTVRKIGNQWFNLNSLLTGPELISDTYLAMFLTQLQQEGYAIFLILGDLPHCEADQLLRVIPAVQPIKPQLITDKSKETQGTAEPDEEFQRVLEESRRLVEDDDQSLKRALAESMQGIDPQMVGIFQSTSKEKSPSPESNSKDEQLSQDEIRRRRLAYLDSKSSTSPKADASLGSDPKASTTASTPPKVSTKPVSEQTEEEMLAAAIKLSMENS